jgi:hypothetical protein
VPTPVLVHSLEPTAIKSNPPMQEIIYSQTLEKRSSLPPLNPPEGFGAPGAPAFEGAGAPGALLHPPKSSSALILGSAGLEVLAVPQPPKASPPGEVMGAGLEVVVWLGAGAGAGAGSGEPHASLDPQASMLLKAEAVGKGGLEAGAGFGGGCDDVVGAAGEDRLNGEPKFSGGLDGDLGFVDAGGGAGAFRSKRSSMPGDEVVGGIGVDFCCCGG